jgi:hypothetical protein
MFSKHLPPSAGAPRVLALDEAAAAELPAEAEVARGRPEMTGEFDAVVGYAAPKQLPALFQVLRPGGRVILARRAEPHALLDALTQAGFVHCLVETVGDLTLYRGERPPFGSSVARVQTLASGPQSLTSDLQLLTSPFVFLLVTQIPNKPAWKLAPDEKLEWRAVTLLNPATGHPTLLAFSSLVKAVAFMQAAILAKTISGVNKVGKFRAEVSQSWELPFVLNPGFEDVREWAPGPAFAADPQTAITGEE